MSSQTVRKKFQRVRRKERQTPQGDVVYDTYITFWFSEGVNETDLGRSPEYRTSLGGLFCVIFMPDNDPLIGYGFSTIEIGKKLWF